MRIRVLGVVGIETDDGAAVEARGNGRALLAALAATPNRAVPTDVLIDSVWGETGAARSTLHVEVSRLRTWMRNRGSDPDRIETSADGYRLRLGTDELDSSRMLDLIRRGERALAADEPSAAATLLTEAVSIWGEPFGGLGYVPPFDSLAAELRETRARAEELLSEAQLAMGSLDVGRLHRLVDEEPTRELRWQQLMLALYRSGRQAEALRVFRAATEHLAETGLVPSKELVELEDAILSRDPGLDPISRITLPAETTTFVGRRLDLESVTELVRDHRLVSVIGPGGVGKSRLALRVARAVGDSLRDGAAFVSLAHVSDPAMVPVTVAAAIGTGPRAGVTALEAVRAAVLDRSLLIVLDNCEHVAEAASAMARDLTATSAGVRVMTTSQHELRVPGAVVWQLAPLTVPASNWPEDLGGSEAVLLFKERAGERTRADLDRHTVDIGRICRHLDGIPLAIELAATLCESRSIPEILTALERGDEVRIQDTTDGIEHHRSWHQAITWSLGLLADDERHALERLAVFRGGFDRMAALDLCSGGSLDRATLDGLLDRLVTKSVLLVDHRDSGVRFSMLESVRRASLETLDPDERRWLLEAHRGYFAGRAIQHGPRMYVGTAEAVDALDADHDNMRAALRLALDGDGENGIAPTSSLASAMVQVLMPYWTTQGHSEEAARWVHEVSATSGEDADPRLEMAAGVASAFNVDYDHAFARLERAEAAFESAGSRTLLAWARFQGGRARTVGVIAGIVDLGELARGADLLASAREQFVDRGDHAGAALAGMFGGVNAVLRADPVADQLLDGALDDARSAGPVDLEAMASAMRALVDLRDSKFEHALRHFEESAVALRRDRNWLNAQICTALAAYAAHGAGLDDARRLAAEACRLQVAFGSAEWDALTLTTAALIAMETDVELSQRIVRTLSRFHPKWRQLVASGFAGFEVLLDVGPGPPAPTLDPVEAHRTAADVLA